MSAKLRHRVRGQTIVLTVTPNDGRFPEKFDVSAPEARRFAWALLADLVPLDAELAAEEEGRSLADLTAPVVIVRRPLHGVLQRERRRSEGLGDKSRRVLKAVVAGARTTADIRSRCTGVADVSAILCGLRDAGLVMRRDAGGQGIPADWGPTEAGRQRLAELEAA